MTRVAVCTPASHSVLCAYHHSMIAMLMHALNGTYCDAVTPIMIQGSILQMSRAMLAKKAVESGATHVLWVDSDMKFPADSLERLLARKKDIVGANYRIKDNTGAGVAIGLDGKRVRFGKEGLEPVIYTGFGLLLHTVEVLKSTKYPWFEMTYVARLDTWLGEDAYFSGKSKEAGFTTYVDHDLSMEVAHVGEFAYMGAS